MRQARDSGLFYLNDMYKKFADRRPGAGEREEELNGLPDLQHLMFMSRKIKAAPRMPGAHRLNAALRKVVAERFVQARELNGMTQTDASRLMGYTKSSQLSLWEHGNRLPPIDRMIIASLVYGVSLDFLFGLSDEPERDPQFAARMALTRTMEDRLRAHSDRIAESLMVLSKQSSAIHAGLVKEVVAKCGELTGAVRRFVQLNAEEFEGMPGGATLMHACAALEAVADEASATMARTEGIAEHAMATAERRANKTYPLLDSRPQQGRQASIEGL